jgi:probable rRNA maturation factor
MKLIFSDPFVYGIPKSLFSNLLKRLPLVLLASTLSEVELLLTNNAEIHALNKQYRGIDKPTDVLSFESTQMPSGIAPAQIVISVERAREQAKEIGQSLHEELRFLFAHGLMHISGFDHKTPAEEEVMLGKVYELLGRKPQSETSKTLNN